MTAEELLALGEECRCELLEGELVEMSPTSVGHMVVTSRLAEALLLYFRANPIGRAWVGEGGYIIARGPDTVVAPDIAVVSLEQARDATPTTRGFFPFAPLIAIEVKSPWDREAAIARKLALYLEANVPEVWWVRPDHSIVTIHRPDGPLDLLRSGDALTGAVLPGFSLDLAALFAE
jgi:Uma2 family endonuclease